tara:strand:- start:206 stop:418 length:213 start_codon:yes stop_codon:yes gene_type:complete
MKMNSIMQIDGIGKRYGLLPSQVIKDADTFDLYIMDAAMSFENYHKKKQSTGKAPIPEYTQTELLELMGK